MIENRYIYTAPSDQLALDLFRGEWSSAMPGSRPDLSAGAAGLFDDPRIKWAAKELGGFKGKRLLELGPLEGGHSWMAEQMGAKSVTAIESNVRAYLKCLVVKEVLGLPRTRFLLGDFNRYFEEQAGGDPFDICLASGVLYHMTDPIGLMRSIRKHARSAFLWTHYYDGPIMEAREDTPQRFSRIVETEALGRKFRFFEYCYTSAHGWTGFCGAGANSSFWMLRDELLAALELVGFRNIRVAMDQPDHPNGPAFCVVAE